MTDLYLLKDNLEIERLKNKYKVLLIVFIFLFVLSLGSFITFSAFKTRTLFIILSSIICTIEFFFVIYFAGKTNFYKALFFEHTTLSKGEKKCHYLKFDDISLKPITLQDRSKVYEVRFIGKNGNINLFLSYLYSNDTFIKDKEYKIYTVYDYIVGYEDAD